MKDKNSKPSWRYDRNDLNMSMFERLEDSINNNLTCFDYECDRLNQECILFLKKLNLLVMNHMILNF